MKSLASLGPWILSAVSLGGIALQQRHITELENRLAALRDAPAAAPATVDLRPLTARLERLESARAMALPPAPAGPSAAAPATGSAAELHQLREDVDALLTGEASATEQGKARLRSLIAETQQQQWSERQQRRDERILERLTEAARLSPRQREDLSKILEAERSERQTLLTSARGQGNMESLRPALQALRTQTEQKARAILDADQLSQFTAARTPGRGFGGPGGPGGGPGGTGP